MRNEFDVTKFLTQLWSEKKTGISIALVCGIVFGALSFLYKPVFTSSATITEARSLEADMWQDNAASGGIGGLVGSALRGGGVGSGGARIDEYAAILQSESFRDRTLLAREWAPLLFPERWNSTDGRWEGGGGFSVGGLLLKLRRTISPASKGGSAAGPSLGSPWDEKARAIEAAGGPSLYQLQRKLSQIVDIEQDLKTGFIEITATSDSPYKSRQLVLGMVDSLNDFERKRGAEDAARKVTYLEKQLLLAQNESVRGALAMLLEQELRIEMVSSVVHDYAVRVLVWPVAPEIRSAPRRTLFLLFGVFIGSVGFALYEAVILSRAKREDE